MPLHPLAERFADVADAYERGRPEYAPAAVGAMAAELKLAPGARLTGGETPAELPVHVIIGLTALA